MRSTLVLILLLAVTPLLGLAALAPAEAGAAIPCVEVYRVERDNMTVCVDPTSASCPVFVRQTTGWLSHAYCAPPEPAFGASLARCHTLVDEPHIGEQVCVDVDDRGCIVTLEHRTSLGAATFCLVPQPPPL